jgi:hypothetical protein
MSYLTAVAVEWIDLGRTDAAVVKVHRAGKPERLAATSAVHLHRTDHPVVAARVIVNIDSPENDVGAPETIECPLADFLPANANGLFRGEPERRTVTVSIPVAGESITRRVAARARDGRAVTEAVPVAGKSVPIAGKSIARRVAAKAVVTPASRPDQVEGVTFRTAVPILNPHHGRTAAPGITDQVLPTSAVDPLEPEVRGIVGHPAGAFEAAPLRRLTGYGPQDGIISAHFHFRDAIHHHLNGAFAFVGAFATVEGGPA